MTLWWKLIDRFCLREVRFLFSGSETPNHHFIGLYGEKVAASWLRHKGVKILYKNFKAPRGGELDLVARKKDLLLFIEVKTRYELHQGRPLEAVDRKKREYLKKAGLAWLKLLGKKNVPYRYDVIEVVLKEGEIPLVNQVEDIDLDRVTPVAEKSFVQGLRV